MADIDVIIKMLTGYYKNYEDNSIQYYLKKAKSPNNLENNFEFNSYFKSENFGANIKIVEDKEQMFAGYFETLEKTFTNEYILTNGYGFCGRNMNANYLKDTIDNDEYYALLKFKKISENNIILHSAITFSAFNPMEYNNNSANNNDNKLIMFVHAICVNQPLSQTGGGILINRLFDICIITSIEIIVLEALTSAVDFYKKLGFEEIRDANDIDTGTVKMSNTTIMKNVESRQNIQQQERQLQQNLEILVSVLEEAPQANEDEDLERIARLKNSIISKRRIKRPRQYADFEVEYLEVPGREVIGGKYNKTKKYNKRCKTNKYNKTKKYNKRCKTNKYKKTNKRGKKYIFGYTFFKRYIKRYKSNHSYK